MTIEFYNYLETLYNAFEEASSNVQANQLDRKVQELSAYIHQNAEKLTTDLSRHKEHEGLYQRITKNRTLSKLHQDIQSIKQNAELLQLASTPDKLITWLGVSDQNPETLLKALEALKGEYGPIVSKMIVIALRLNTPDRVISLFKEREMQLTALAHFVNAHTISLKHLNLSIAALNLIAPRLTYVNCRDIPFKDETEVDTFLKNCSNAHKLLINSDKLTKFKQLPETLQLLDCRKSPNLNELNLSHLPSLQELYCPDCPLLKTLNYANHQKLQVLECSFCVNLTQLQFSNCAALQEFVCFGCPNIPELDFSNCLALQRVDCSECDELRTLHFRNCKALQRLDCNNCSKLKQLNLSDCGALKGCGCPYCPELTEIDVSDCEALETLFCFQCSKLKRLNLSNCQTLQTLNCSKCSTLETIISAGLPNCRRLNHSECPLLTQLPQLPPGATVHSYNSISFNSFEVAPDDLKTKPLEVLCHLGEVILKDKRMPNIVYLNSPGLDAGGLRRQLVTTLMQNQFPVEAYKTIGMLIALAALGSLPLGRSLNSGFYYALLNLEEDELHLEKKIQSLALYGVPDEEIDVVDHSITLPIAWAAKGFREIADPKRFRDMPLNDFVTKVAGLEVNWENFNNLALYKGADREKIRGFFKKFFEKNPQLVIDVVELFTASRALGSETIKIIIDETLDKGSLFSMSTCFQQVKLPPYNTYELFEEKLLKTIEHTLGHFGKA